MNRRWAEDDEQMPVALSAFHWRPVRSTKKMASIAARSGTRGLWQPKGCPGRSGKSGSILAHNSSGKRQPSSFTRSAFTPDPITPQSPYLEIQTITAYRDRL
jgi:hypothetical protein